MKKQNNILVYRTKHHRCRYCRYKKIIHTPFIYENLVTCKLKDIYLNLNNNFLGLLCKYYKPNLKEEDEI